MRAAQRLVQHAFAEQLKALDCTFTNLLDTLDPRITRARAGSKWVFNESRVLTEVPENVMAAHANCDHDPVTGEALGWLIEEQRINYVAYPETLAQWTLSECSDSGETFTTPKGASFPVLLASGAAASHRVTEGLVSGPAGTTVMTTGCFVYIPSGSDITRLIIRIRANANATGQSVVLSVTGTGESAVFAFVSSITFGTDAPAAVTASAVSSSYVGGGVHVVSITSAASANAAHTISGMDVSFTPATFEAAPGTANSKCGIWGLFSEAGAFRTSCNTNNNGSATTRARDIATITDLDSIGFNAAGSSLLWDFIFEGVTPGADNVVWSFNDETTDERIDLRYASGSNSLVLVIVDGGSTVATVNSGITPVAGTRYRCAAGWGTGVARLAINGTGYTEQAPASLPTVTRFEPARIGAGNYGNQWARQGVYVAALRSQSALDSWSTIA